MGLPNRTRDFTSATWAELMESLSGPTEESREFRDFWNNYGSCFDNLDLWNEAVMIDEFISQSRYLMSDLAPREFQRVYDRIHELDEAFGKDCENTVVELQAYGKSLDALTEAISGKGFPANFDKGKLDAKLKRLHVDINPDKTIFLKGLMLRYGIDWKTANLIWRFFGRNMPTSLTASYAIPMPQPIPHPGYVAIFLLWLLANFGIWAIGLVDWDSIWEWVTGGTSTTEPPPIGTLGLGTASGPYPSIGLDSLPENARTAYNRYRKQGWKGTLPGATPGTGAGGNYRNLGEDGSAILPKTDANGNPITYREFDVNNKEGDDKDGERLVLGTDGKVYYTNDHYVTFVEVTPEAGTGNSGNNNDNNDNEYEPNNGNNGGNGGNQTPPPNLAPA